MFAHRNCLVTFAFRYSKAGKVKKLQKLQNLEGASCKGYLVCTGGVVDAGQVLLGQGRLFCERVHS